MLSIVRLEITQCLDILVMMNHFDPLLQNKHLNPPLNETSLMSSPPNFSIFFSNIYINMYKTCNKIPLLI